MFLLTFKYPMCWWHFPTPFLDKAMCPSGPPWWVVGWPKSPEALGNQRGPDSYPSMTSQLALENAWNMACLEMILVFNIDMANHHF